MRDPKIHKTPPIVKVFEAPISLAAPPTNKLPMGMTLVLTVRLDHLRHEELLKEYGLDVQRPMENFWGAV